MMGAWDDMPWGGPEDVPPAALVNWPAPGRGSMVPLPERLARQFCGDPLLHVSPSSTGPSAPAGLPDYPGARCAVLFVSGGAVNFRLDGQPPAAGGDQQAASGSTIILTGQPSIKGFLFASAAAVTTVLFGTYFD